MTAHKLLPCANCGGIAHFEGGHVINSDFEWIECSRYGMRTNEIVVRNQNSSAFIRDLWNKRTNHNDFFKHKK